MAGGNAQVGGGNLRVKDGGIVVAGNSDACCCGAACYRRARFCLSGNVSSYFFTCADSPPDKVPFFITGIPFTCYYVDYADPTVSSFINLLSTTDITYTSDCEDSDCIPNENRCIAHWQYHCATGTMTLIETLCANPSDQPSTWWSWKNVSPGICEIYIWSETVCTSPDDCPETAAPSPPEDSAQCGGCDNETSGKMAYCATARFQWSADPSLAAPCSPAWPDEVPTSGDVSMPVVSGAANFFVFQVVVGSLTVTLYVTIAAECPHGILTPYPNGSAGWVLDAGSLHAIGGADDCNLTLSFDGVDTWTASCTLVGTSACDDKNYFSATVTIVNNGVCP